MPKVLGLGSRCTLRRLVLVSSDTEVRPALQAGGESVGRRSLPAEGVAGRPVSATPAGPTPADAAPPVWRPGTTDRRAEAFKLVNGSTHDFARLQDSGDVSSPDTNMTHLLTWHAAPVTHSSPGTNIHRFMNRNKSAKARVRLAKQSEYAGCAPLF